MREYNFKAKAAAIHVNQCEITQSGVAIGQWIQGHLFEECIDMEDGFVWEDGYFIKMPYGDHYQDIEVDPKTICEFTGLTLNKNQSQNHWVDVFEGDILLTSDIAPEEEFPVIGVVYYNKDLFCYMVKDNFGEVQNLFEWAEGESKVIGNRVDNPELMNRINKKLPYDPEIFNKNR